MARVLIIEQDGVAAEAAAMICKAARLSVTVADTGVEALLLLAALPYDLVIIGARLHRMEGAALAAAIRGGEGGQPSVPIVGVATAADEPGQEALLEAGVDAVVTKPYRNDELARAVARLLARGPARVTLFRSHPLADARRFRLDA